MLSPCSLRAQEIAAINTPVTFQPTLSLDTLLAIASHVAQYGYAELPPLTPDDILVLNLLVQAEERRLH